MKRLFSMTTASAAVLALTACAGMRYDEVKGQAPAGNAYNAALQKGYVNLSKNEWTEGDYKDSDRFAGRAKAAAAGSPPAPEEIGARRLPADKVGDLTAARNKLAAALAATASSKNPAAAAEAQVMFDCWMQEQEENFQPKDIEACKKGFEAAMAKIEEPAAARPASVMATPDRYLVFFDWNKSNITGEARQVIGTAAANAKKDKIGSLKVVGHTDTSGPADYNMKLSVRRADSTKRELNAQGFKGGIATEGRGETELLVQTKDGVREAKNRRAEIIFGKPGA
jgi:outer membrane protein OmpA-like peptidoglycan-associated protein